MDSARSTGRERPSMDEPVGRDLPHLIVRRAPTSPLAGKPRLFWLGGICALLSAAVAAFSISSRPAPPAAAAPAETIVGIGHIIPQSDVIAIGPPFGATGARIATLAVEEGQTVEAGAVLATLDNQPLRAAAAQSAAALVALREAQLEQTRVATNAARAEAAASLARARTTFEEAERELARTETLVARGAAADAALDRRRAQREEAERDVDRGQATLARYGKDAETAPDVQVAAQALVQARADAAKAREEQEQALVRAPIDGTVLSIDIRPGEAITARDMMTIGDLDRMRVKAEIYETSRHAVEPGARVTITARALPEPLAGRVSHVGRAVKRQTMIGESPAAATDARVFEVHIDLDEPSSAIARYFTNLQVTARIDPTGTP